MRLDRNTDRRTIAYAGLTRATGVITTVVGNGAAVGFGGDGGPATAATVNQPVSVSIDRDGNLFFADSNNNRIRKVDGTTGIISTVAGTGEYGSSGDGGAATMAALAWPYGVAVDGLGNLFIADTYNSKVRRVDQATGVITTVETRLTFPYSVATDGGSNLYVADSDGNRVEKLDLRTGISSIVAGNGTRVFSGDGGRRLRLNSATRQASLSVSVASCSSLIRSPAGFDRSRLQE